MVKARVKGKKNGQRAELVTDFLDQENTAVTLPSTSSFHNDELCVTPCTSPRNRQQLDVLADVAVNSANSSPEKLFIQDTELNFINSTPLKRPIFDVQVIDQQAEGIKRIRESFNAQMTAVSKANEVMVEKTVELEETENNLRRMIPVIQEEREYYEAQLTGLSAVRDELHSLRNEYDGFKRDSVLEMNRKVLEASKNPDDSERNQELLQILSNERKMQQEFQQRIQEQSDQLQKDTDKLLQQATADATQARVELRQYFMTRKALENVDNSFSEGENAIMRTLEDEERAMRQYFEESMKKIAQGKKEMSNFLQKSKDTITQSLQQWQNPEKTVAAEDFQEARSLCSVTVSQFTEASQAYTVNGNGVSPECNEWLKLKPSNAVNVIFEWLTSKGMGFLSFDSARKLFMTEKYFKLMPNDKGKKIEKHYKVMIVDFLKDKFYAHLAKLHAKDGYVDPQAIIGVQKHLSERVKNAVSNNYNVTVAWNHVFGDNVTLPGV